MKCCMTKGCVAFNYDSSSKVCALSASSFSKVRPVPGKHTSMTCQKSAAGDDIVEDTLENIVADATEKSDEEEEVEIEANNDEAV